MRGESLARRPPKMIAEIGTPVGESNSGEMQGHCLAGAVNRLLACAAGLTPSQGWPFQSMRPAGGSLVSPSHHGVLSGASATLVKIEFERRLASALGLVFSFVPGATPKNPASGLMAQRRP